MPAKRPTITTTPGWPGAFIECHTPGCNGNIKLPGEATDWPTERLLLTVERCGWDADHLNTCPEHAYNLPARPDVSAILSRLSEQEKEALIVGALRCRAELGRHLEWDYDVLVESFDEILREASPKWLPNHSDQTKATARWWADLGHQEYDEDILEECDSTEICPADDHDGDCPRNEEPMDYVLESDDYDCDRCPSTSIGHDCPEDPEG